MMNLKIKHFTALWYYNKPNFLQVKKRSEYRIWKHRYSLSHMFAGNCVESYYFDSDRYASTKHATYY